MMWWVVMAAGAFAMIAFASRGPNAVWGTATVGVLIGVGLALYQPGFNWWTIAKSVAVAALIGAIFEALPLLAGKRQR